MISETHTQPKGILPEKNWHAHSKKTPLTPSHTYTRTRSPSFFFFVDFQTSGKHTAIPVHSLFFFLARHLFDNNTQRFPIVLPQHCIFFLSRIFRIASAAPAQVYLTLLRFVCFVECGWRLPHLSTTQHTHTHAVLRVPCFSCSSSCRGRCRCRCPWPR
jgi:hypothetical protein